MAYQVVTTVTKPTSDVAWWGKANPDEYQSLVNWELINLAELQLSKTFQNLDENTLINTTIYASEEAFNSAVALRSEHPLAKARNAYNTLNNITNFFVGTEI